MPFQSEAQRRFMYANEPEIAKRWEKETKTKRLPEKVSSVTYSSMYDELEKIANLAAMAGQALSTSPSARGALFGSVPKVFGPNIPALRANIERKLSKAPVLKNKMLDAVEGMKGTYPQTGSTPPSIGFQPHGRSSFDSGSNSSGASYGTVPSTGSPRVGVILGSPSPAIAAHEMAHAKDFSLRGDVMHKAPTLETELYANRQAVAAQGLHPELAFSQAGYEQAAGDFSALKRKYEEAALSMYPSEISRLNEQKLNLRSMGDKLRERLNAGQRAQSPTIASQSTSEESLIPNLKARYSLVKKKDPSLLRSATKVRMWPTEVTEGLSPGDVIRNNALRRIGSRMEGLNTELRTLSNPVAHPELLERLDPQTRATIDQIGKATSSSLDSGLGQGAGQMAEDELKRVMDYFRSNPVNVGPRVYPIPG